MLAQNVKVSIVRAHFEERVIRSIPLIQKFLDNVQSLAEMESDRSLIRFSTRITFHPDLHTLIVTSIPRPEAESKKHRCQLGERPFIAAKAQTQHGDAESETVILIAGA